MSGNINSGPYSFPPAGTLTPEQRTLLNSYPSTAELTERDRVRKLKEEEQEMREHINCIFRVNQKRREKGWYPLINFTKEEAEWNKTLLEIDSFGSVPTKKGGNRKKTKRLRSKKFI
jgi:hypothetical protein